MPASNTTSRNGAAHSPPAASTLPGAAGNPPPVSPMAAPTPPVASRPPGPLGVFPWAALNLNAIPLQRDAEGNAKPRVHVFSGFPISGRPLPESEWNAALVRLEGRFPFRSDLIRVAYEGLQYLISRAAAARLLAGKRIEKINADRENELVRLGREIAEERTRIELAGDRLREEERNLLNSAVQAFGQAGARTLTKEDLLQEEASRLDLPSSADPRDAFSQKR